MINLSFKNYTNSTINGDESELMDVWNAFQFWVPGYRFSPSFINGAWDGRIKLINLKTHEFPTGLLVNIIKYCEETSIDIKVEGFSSLNTDTDMSFINDYRFWSKGKQITPREDQIRAVKRALDMERCVNVCPTSFGKSLSIFIECLYHIKQNRKCLIIVPTISLVSQFANDIKDYCKNGTEPWMPSLYQITGGSDKNIPDGTDIVISTWQSIYKQDSEWFSNFDVIILDEAHKGKAVCLQSIFNKSPHCRYKTGWTGTLKSSTIDGLQVQALFGEAESIVTTSELMERGVVANLTVNIVRFNYSEEAKNELYGVPYADEIKFIETCTKRTKMIARLAGQFNNTGLILFNHIKHGKEIHDTLVKMYPNKNIYMVTGSTVSKNGVSYKEFSTLKDGIEKEESAILVCSYGVFSTGISIKNLHWIMFGSPMKSFVRTIQSIGRGLRISETKSNCALVDIVDILKPEKKKKFNYCMKHFQERFNIYSEQQFSYKMLSINL